MACPNVANDEISMLKTARERTGAGYTSSFSITNPIYMSDLQRLTGGNTSGSGNSYPAVNFGNQVTNRPDGSNPLQFSEFSQYDQNPQRTAFEFIYSSSSSTNACAFGLPSGTAYYHTDPNNLVPSSGAGIYTAYTTQTGTTVATAGYYAIYTTGGSPSGSWMQVGNNGLIIATGSC